MSHLAVIEEPVMKIYVNRVPEQGLTEHLRYDPAAMDMERMDVRLPESFEVDAVITKVERELVVSVDIRCPIRLTCARCLKEFPSTVATDAVFSYTVQPSDIVDITDDVRQEIILAYPMIPVCQPDCKGLCASCGQNLNVEPCGHQPVEGP